MSEHASPIQHVSATAGFAYGVIGADIHVFGDGSPVYLLQNWRPAPAPDPRWLRELPSRMLHARLQVVEFTGRRSEIDDLRRWRDSPPRLAVRWLHGAGGQGKSRLADQLAAESIATGWKCVIARRGAGTVLPPPGSEDLRLDGGVGVLLVIDYADQWPLPHLTWLLSNALLHRISVPARVLMLARSVDVWPSVRAALADLQAATSGQHLAALPGDDDGRAEMFRAARDGFADRYGTAAADRIPPPASLAAPEMGLTLAVHMAALVAVDTYVTGGAVRPPPGDIEGLTIYLLDREHLQWARLSASGEHHFRTTPAVLNQAVFCAALTGPLPRAQAAAALSFADDVEQVIADHTYCYPPVDARTALEPLYPDRLAEDFLALTLPGHTADYPAQPWAPETATTVLGPRGVTFLVAAAERWPHVRTRHLYPMLRGAPRLATQAGSAVLTRLAAFPDVDPEVLELIDADLPLERHVDLDVGAAAIGTALLPHRIARLSAVDPDLLATVLSVQGWRVSQTGRPDEAAAHLGRAVAIRRERAHDEPRSALVSALAEYASALYKAGRLAEAVNAGEEAVALARTAPYDTERRVSVAYATQVISVCLGEQGRPAEAEARSREAVTLWRSVISTGADEHLQQLSQCLLNRGNLLWAQGHRSEGLTVTAEAVEIFRRLAAGKPARHLPDLALGLHGLAIAEWNAGRPEQATLHSREATGILRDLVAANPDAFLPHLAVVLSTMGNLLAAGNARTEAMTCLQEAAGITRTLVDRNPALYVPRLAEVLLNVGALHSSAGDTVTAVAYTREAAGHFRRLAEGQPELFRLGLAAALNNLASQLADLGADPSTVDEALACALEAVSLDREAARDHPGAALPALTMALGTLSHLQADHGRADKALLSAQEAVAITRQLAVQEPAAHLLQLSRALTNLSIRQARTGAGEPALSTMREVVDICRRLVRDSSALHRPALAQALRNLAVRSAALGRPEDALPPAVEAARIEEDLSSDRPAADRDDLAKSLVIVARLCAETGWREAALAHVRRAVAIHRRAAMVGGPATARGLRETLAAGHDTFARYGYAAEAAQLRQELSDSRSSRIR